MADIIEKNGKLYKVTHRSVQAGAGNRAPSIKTERAVPYYHIVNVKAKICGGGTVAAPYDFFSEKPVNKPIDGNFTNEGIRHDMRIFGIKGVIKPFVMGTADADTVSLINALYESSWTLKLGEGTEILSGLFADILPKPIINVLDSATPTYTARYEDKEHYDNGFVLLRKEPGTIDPLGTKDSTSVVVSFKPATFPATVVDTISLGIVLLTVPIREFPNG